jgi:hypothetical protein
MSFPFFWKGNHAAIEANSSSGGPETWLLRLFESSFFDTWLAATYLFKFIDNIGIQYYLCQRLKEFPLDEVEFLLPQLW